MYLTRYGVREWLIISLLAAALAVVLGIFVSWWLLLAVAPPWLALMAFFRDPIRPVPDNLPDEVMLAPSDGTVSAVERVDEHEATGGQPAVIVRIFMSVLDVHVNRAPQDGEVVALNHRPGKYHNAQTDLSARENESNLITLRLPGGETFGVRQIAGMIARRIVCRLKVGDRVQRGGKFGMVKFGSTTELILPRPDEVSVHVTVGQKVTGGLTLLATLNPGEES
jgi:phosphatidylserine decarboxylase